MIVLVMPCKPAWKETPQSTVGNGFLWDELEGIFLFYHFFIFEFEWGSCTSDNLVGGGVGGGDLIDGWQPARTEHWNTKTRRVKMLKPSSQIEKRRKRERKGLIYFLLHISFFFFLTEGHEAGRQDELTMPKNFTWWRRSRQLETRGQEEDEEDDEEDRSEEEAARASVFLCFPRSFTIDFDWYIFRLMFMSMTVFSSKTPPSCAASYNPFPTFLPLLLLLVPSYPSVLPLSYRTPESSLFRWNFLPWFLRRLVFFLSFDWWSTSYRLITDYRRPC